LAPTIDRALEGVRIHIQCARILGLRLAGLADTSYPSMGRCMLFYSCFPNEVMGGGSTQLHYRCEDGPLPILNRTSAGVGNYRLNDASGINMARYEGFQNTPGR